METIFLKKRLATFHTQLCCLVENILAPKKSSPSNKVAYEFDHNVYISWKKIAQKGKYADPKISKEKKMNSFNWLSARRRQRQLSARDN